MSISPFFNDLRSAYQSELDDLRFDSEGRDVLHHRLAGKRQEMAFLVQMMELSPEMVAVVFHQAFDFKQRSVMEHLLTHEEEGFPAWSSVADAVELAPWARDLARNVLASPGGEKFLAITAGLEYMAGLPVAVAAGAEGTDEVEGEDEENDQDGDDLVIFDDDGEGGQGGDARARQEAGADWLVQQGFDHKD